MSPLKLVTGPVAATRSAAGAAFAKLLSKELTAMVELIPTPSYGDLLEVFVAGGAELAWLPPAVYVRARERAEVALLGSGVRQHRAHFRGALFARRDRSFADLRDAEGSVVAWVDRNSCAGYLFPRLALRERGIVPDRFFLRERLFGDHLSVVRAVADGDADVGATFVHLAGDEDDAAVINTGWKLLAERTKMRRLLVTARIPADTLCAGPQTHPILRERFWAAMQGLHQSAEGREALRALFGVERFEPSTPSQYDVVERALESA